MPLLGLVYSFHTNKCQFDNIRSTDVEAALCTLLLSEGTLYLNPTLQYLALGLILIQ